MGADVFFTNASGKTAQEAFDEAVHRARYDWGHAGYSGTLAEKDDFTMIPLPEGEKLSSFTDKLIDECDPRIDDKWGPAGCIQIGVDSDSGRKEFLFFGWASS
jgi:hypothetical protein